MQPVQVDQTGSTFSSLAGFRGTPQLTFNKSASVVCLYDSQHIQCYRGPNQWSYIFSWHVASEFHAPVSHERKTVVTKDEGCVDSWRIETVEFGPNFTSSNPRLTGASTDSLLVVLANYGQNVTCLCHFPYVNNKRYFHRIYLHGLVSASEWVPSRLVESTLPISPVSSERSTMLLDTTDVHTSSHIQQNARELLPFSNGFCDLLAVGFRQGLVGVIAPFAFGQRDASFAGEFPEPVWAVAVDKTQFINMKSHLCSDGDVSTGLDENAFTYLDDSVVRWNEFQYKSVNGRVLVSLTAHSVYVSTLRFIPNTQTLVVGYSFGGWQLWSIRTLSLDAQVKLYQLHYKQRFEESSAVSGEVTYNYQSLVGLSERLYSELFAEGIDRQLSTNQLLRIQPIRTRASSAVAAANQSDAAHLVALMWTVCPGVVRVGLFDLDRWYHAQMPTQIRPDNSFFAIFDAPLPNEDAVALCGYLLDHSMESFWSRIAARERQLDVLCEPYGVTDSPQSSLQASQTIQSRTNVATASGRPAPRPVPEVCLRPSAISFSVLLVWLSRQHCPNPGGFLLARFASRQEVCLMSLNSAEYSGEKRFSPTEWLSEAWATGLLESPGLDLIEEEDLERLLQLSHQLNDHLSTLTSNTALIGFRLAYGEGFDMTLIHNVDDLEEKGSSELIGPPGKRARLHGASKSLISIDEPGTDEQIVLSPSWVLLMNCLLEQGHLSALKSIEKLAQTHGPYSPANLRFRKYWFWLRFQRLKIRFDEVAEPLFSSNLENDSTESRTLLDLDKDSFSLGAVAYQIQQLAILGDHWFDKVTQTPLTGHASTLKPKLSLVKAVETYAQYTRLVLFLCRLGLLPQLASRTNFENDLEDLNPTKNAFLLPYSSSQLMHAIGYFRERSGLDGELETPLSEALLHNCLGWTQNSPGETEPLRIWCEQEFIDSKRTSPRYPPQRVQSLCALWQLDVHDPTWSRMRAALLGFILCDATAATAASGRLVSDIENPVNSNMLAVQLCRRVLSLYARVFPAVRHMLPTLFTLWLLDRACFKEARASHLKAYVTGTQQNPWDGEQLVTLFPNQFNILKKYLQQNKQADLYSRFTPTAVDSNAHAQLVCLPFESVLNKQVTPDDLRPVGAPFLSLIRFRRAAQKFECLRDSEAPDEALLDKAERGLRDTFIQFLDVCRRAGRLGDVINLGLTVWETQVLVDHYLETRQYNVLFYCLVARKQYKSALYIYNEFLRKRYISTLSGGQTGSSGARGDSMVSLVANLLANSIPGFHMDQLSEFSERQPLIDALAHPFVTTETSEVQHKSPNFVAYRRDDAVTCPLTTAKLKVPSAQYTSQPLDSLLRPRRTASSQYNEEDRNEDERLLRRSDSSPVHRRDIDPLSESIRTSRLLDTARKSSSEFWDTFRELENLQRSCNLSMEFSLLSKSSQRNPSWAVGSLVSSQSARQSSSRHSEMFKMAGKDQLLNANSRRCKRTQSGRVVSPPRPMISARRSYHKLPLEDDHMPISILKLDEMRHSVTDENPSFEFATPLNPRVAITKLSEECQDVHEPDLSDKTHTPEPLVRPCTTALSRDDSSPHKDGISVDLETVVTDVNHETTSYPISPRKPLSACRGTSSPKDKNPGDYGIKRVHDRIPTSHSSPERPVNITQPTGHRSSPQDSKQPTVILEDDFMDLDDTASIASSMSQDNDASSFSSETPRRSMRRVKPPKRYDAAQFK
ncbi:hypothetical protein FGIG_01060 [Fasciola gigantica]|uniref:ELYS beta-propeller domain-containing protein n=1 Tax=Fasciola gigantica TaxID=46835 RepID=A0A504Z3A3_FASGI|nr:hypothetical protein FGIG_01060 [Fasciola gigantica]